jgi:hypothetical protein
VDTEVRPQGMEFGIVAERWTRVWWFFERAEAEDWQATVGGTRRDVKAYKMSIWVADVNRDPVRTHKDVVLAFDPGSTGLSTVRWVVSVGDGNIVVPGRGTMTAYLRNVVVLHGTPRADVLAMLQKPVN